MDVAIANKIISFIFSATGRSAIICDLDGVIIAAKVATRVGTVHPGARTMMRENLPIAMVTEEEEAASGGLMKAGCNTPIWHDGELLGSIGISGDPMIAEPVTRMASGLFSKELQERAILTALIGHAGQMDQLITEIVSTVALADVSQTRVAGEVGDVRELIEQSFEDIQRTDEVIGTIHHIASNTQMLGLNASIEAAHAREHGRGFAIVAEAVRKLSIQCGEAAESVRATQNHLHTSMSQVVSFAKNLMADTQAQTDATSAIAKRVGDLKAVSEALMAMTLT